MKPGDQSHVGVMPKKPTVNNAGRRAQGQRTDTGKPAPEVSGSPDKLGPMKG